MIKYNIIKDDFVIINISMEFFLDNFDEILDSLKKISDYKFPIIDIEDIVFPNIHILELFVRIYNIFELESKMTIINASRNYKKIIKLYGIENLFTFQADEYEAMKYYKNYMLKRLWHL